jgi:hypothetical protein
MIPKSPLIDFIKCYLGATILWICVVIPQRMRTLVNWILAVMVTCLLPLQALGIITYGTGDPSHNTTPPDGALANSGWQFAGQWGGFTGWPISIDCFLTATHVGGAVGNQLILNGHAYTTVATWTSPRYDLTVWKVSEMFPAWVNIYALQDETGKAVIMIGRGTQRGVPIELGCNGQTNLVGWSDGPGDGVLRWGTNVITDTGGGYLYCHFTNAGADTGAVTDGDSSGGLFILDGVEWKLGGVWYARAWSSGYNIFSHSCGTAPTVDMATSVGLEANWIYWACAGGIGTVPAQTPQPPHPTLPPPQIVLPPINFKAQINP